MTLDLDKTTWKRVAFGDVVKNVNVSVKDPAAAGIDRVVAMEHLEPGELKINSWGSIEDGTTFTRLVRPGQTLFGKRRAYQRKAAYADFDAICSGDILVFEADAGQLLPELLPFLVQSNRFYDHALGTSAGSLSPRTNWRDLSSFEFDLPPLDEQQRIADLLWSVEHHLRELRISLTSLTVAAATWANQVLSGWDWSLRVRDAIDAKRPLCYGVVQPGIDDPGGVAMIRVLDLESGAPTRDCLKRVSAEIDMQYRRSRVVAGDVLVSIVGTIGRTWVVTDEFAGCNIARALARLAPDRNAISSEFLAWVLTSRRAQDSLMTSAFESARKTLNLGVLSELPLPSLSVADQEEVLKLRRKVAESLDGLDREGLSTQVLRGSIMACVFGGAE